MIEATRIMSTNSCGTRHVAGALLLAAIASAGNGADGAPPGTMALESPACAEVIDFIEVDIAVGVQSDPWVGAQALLAYDNDRLLFVTQLPGDPLFDMPVYFDADTLLGHLDVAVGISPGGGDTIGGVVIATLLFVTLEVPDPCPIEQLVWFRKDPDFTSRLSMDDGTPIEPTLVDLGPVSVSDGPELTPPSDIVWALPQFSGCVSGLSPGDATATSPCDPAPVISWIRSDGGPTLLSPYLWVNSPITITWTATDDCGRTDEAVQTIEVLGCLADFNLDSMVDGDDLGTLLGYWASGSGFADLNCDGTVDGDDLGTLLGQWGPC